MTGFWRALQPRIECFHSYVMKGILKPLEYGNIRKLKRNQIEDNFVRWLHVRKAEIKDIGC